MAFPSRLTTICEYGRIACKPSGTSGRTWQASSSPFCWACRPMALSCRLACRAAESRLFRNLVFRPLSWRSPKCRLAARARNPPNFSPCQELTLLLAELGFERQVRHPIMRSSACGSHGSYSQGIAFGTLDVSAASLARCISSSARFRTEIS